MNVKPPIKNRKKAVWLVVALLLGLFLLRIFNQETSEGGGSPTQYETGVLDRHPQKLILTRHARCRMDCRKVTEGEVREILEKGKINYKKSELQASPDPKYALEGYSSDGQHLRIIFAPSRKGMVVITCIDLQKEWSCSC